MAEQEGCHRVEIANIRSSEVVPPVSVGTVSGCDVFETLQIAGVSQEIQVDHAYGRCTRSEEHTSELQSRLHLVCRLLLEKKKKNETPLQLCDDAELLSVHAGRIRLRFYSRCHYAARAWSHQYQRPATEHHISLTPGPIRF